MEMIGKKKMDKFQDKVNTHAEEKVVVIILYGIYPLNVLLDP
jgi:hypothetical protein